MGLRPFRGVTIGHRTHPGLDACGCENKHSSTVNKKAAPSAVAHDDGTRLLRDLCDDSPSSSSARSAPSLPDENFRNLHEIFRISETNVA